MEWKRKGGDSWLRVGRHVIVSHHRSMWGGRIPASVALEIGPVDPEESAWLLIHSSRRSFTIRVLAWTWSV